MPDQDRAERALDDPLHAADAEAHPPPRRPTSGTLSTADESGVLPVVEPGLSVDPEDLGRQFLRDATEQDNFESLESTEPEGDLAPLDPVLSEATLDAAGQGTTPPESGALDHARADEAPEEPALGDVDLMSSAIRGGSLFDQPTARGGTRSPRVSADEIETFEEKAGTGEVNPEAREAEMREEFAALRSSGSDQRASEADRGAWEGTRRSPSGRRPRRKKRRE